MLVALIVTLKRLAIPLRFVVPVNVAVPAVGALKVPYTNKPDVIVKLTAVVTVPVIDNILNVLVPEPEIVLALPPIVIVPALAAKVPATAKFPVSIMDDVVVTDPVMFRLSGEIEDPVIVVPVPVIVNVPPDAWVNDPDPVVARFPDRVSPSAEKLSIGPAIVRLLKF